VGGAGAGEQAIKIREYCWTKYEKSLAYARLKGPTELSPLILPTPSGIAVVK
jgi:hypothetical protein